MHSLFWRLLPAPAIGGELYRLLALTADARRHKKEFFDAKDDTLKLDDPEPNKNERDVRERILKQFWTTFVGDVFGTATLIQTKTELPFVDNAIDRNDKGWKDERRGGRGQWDWKIGCLVVDLLQGSFIQWSTKCDKTHEHEKGFRHRSSCEQFTSKTLSLRLSPDCTEPDDDDNCRDWVVAAKLVGLGVGMVGGQPDLH